MIQRKKTKFFLLDETKHIFGISGQTGADCNWSLTNHADTD